MIWGRARVKGNWVTAGKNALVEVVLWVLESRLLKRSFAGGF